MDKISLQKVLVPLKAACKGHILVSNERGENLNKVITALTLLLLDSSIFS